MSDFTVIIPTRNRPACVLALLQYLRQDLGWTCPVIVVDQSDDRGAALADRLSTGELGSVLHRPQEERGTGVARNAGARLARTDWLLLLDDDVRPARGYLEALCRFIAQNPWLDAVQPGLKQRDAWDAYRQDPERWLAERHSKPPARFRLPESWDAVRWFIGSPRSRYEVLTIGVGSGNLAISQRAFEGVGGFDEHIEGRGDDAEFGLRLWWYGYRTCVFPYAVAFHLREAEGGLRPVRSRWERLLDPDPAVGWMYFYLKWFPGAIYRSLVRYYVWRAVIVRPWVLPVKWLRLWRSIALAKARLRSGPRYLSPPVSRAETYLPTHANMAELADE
jgi:GT2 family glycosyltransferase